MSDSESKPATQPPPPKRRPPRHGFLYFLGVILPCITIGVELATGMCRGVGLDPIPTWWHVGLLCMVPLAGHMHWRRANGRGVNDSTFVVALLGGSALSVSCIYALLFLPLAPVAAIAIIYFGFGLLPLTPLFSFISTLRFISLKPAHPESISRTKPVALGGVIGLVAMLGPDVQSTRMYAAIDAGIDADRVERPEIFEKLRGMGVEETLLAACYGQRKQTLLPQIGLSMHGFGQGRWFQRQEEARKLYYRVTGDSFSHRRPVDLGGFRSRGGFWGDWEWDSEQGGTSVGGHVRGLRMIASRIDGTADAEAGWSYTEWTMEFQNDVSWNREARTQVVLPPGGVVTRATLWVNGEEREAAFAEHSKVRAAYEKIVQRQCDPLLVTHAGRDRVLVQCFPVLPNGGKMKIRIGITAPWISNDGKEMFLRMPHLAERNFGFAKELESHFDFVSHGDFGNDQIVETAVDGERKHFEGELHPLRLAQADQHFSAVETGRPAVRVQGRRETDLIEQSWEAIDQPAVRRLVFVLDGGRANRDKLHILADSIAEIPMDIEIGVVLERDGMEVLQEPALLPKSQRSTLVSMIREIDGVGGQDIGRAFSRAIDWANEQRPSAVVCFHAAQSTVLYENEAYPDLRRGVRTLSFQTETGPNRLSEKNVFGARLESWPRYRTLEKDFKDLITHLTSGMARGVFHRRLVSDSKNEDALSDASHVARLWAADEVRRLIREEKKGAAVKLAAKYQLVTPVSGAVVLENEQQYEESDLKPVGPDTVPVVPEPGTILLLILGFLTLCWRRIQAFIQRFALT